MHKLQQQITPLFFSSFSDSFPLAFTIRQRVCKVFVSCVSCFSEPWTTMASLGNKVDEQVVKAPQQNGGGCRNEELQLEDILDNNNEVRD